MKNEETNIKDLTESELNTKGREYDLTVPKSKGPNPYLDEMVRRYILQYFVPNQNI